MRPLTPKWKTPGGNVDKRRRRGNMLNALAVGQSPLTETGGCPTWNRGQTQIRGGVSLDG